MESFYQGYRLQQSDLNISFYLQNISYPGGMAFIFSPYYIRYDVLYHYPDETTLRVGPPDRYGTEIKTGVYRPNLIIGDSWGPGTYEILWKYRVYEDSDFLTSGVTFEVLSKGLNEQEIRTYNHGVDFPATVLVLDDGFTLTASFTII